MDDNQLADAAYEQRAQALLRDLGITMMFGLALAVAAIGYLLLR